MSVRIVIPEKWRAPPKRWSWRDEVAQMRGDLAALGRMVVGLVILSAQAAVLLACIGLGAWFISGTGIAGLIVGALWVFPFLAAVGGALIEAIGGAR